MNKEWHEKNPMRKNPTMAQRAEWHLAHQRNCRCRPVPASVLEYMKLHKKASK
jgi:hypothetical protein